MVKKQGSSKQKESKIFGGRAGN